MVIYVHAIYSPKGPVSRRHPQPPEPWPSATGADGPREAFVSMNYLGSEKLEFWKYSLLDDLVLNFLFNFAMVKKYIIM